MTIHRHFQSQTDSRALPAVLAWFDQFQDLPIPNNVRLQCQLALAEGFTNAVRHAHQGLPLETPVTIEVLISDHNLELMIWDQGSGFDLATVLEDKHQTTNEDSEGGRGLKILAAIADRLTYTREGDRNCLHLVKHF